MTMPKWTKQVEWNKSKRSTRVHAFDNPGALVPLCGAERLGPWDDGSYSPRLACKRCVRAITGGSWRASRLEEELSESNRIAMEHAQRIVELEAFYTEAQEMTARAQSRTNKMIGECDALAQAIREAIEWRNKVTKNGTLCCYAVSKSDLPMLDAALADFEASKGDRGKVPVLLSNEAVEALRHTVPQEECASRALRLVLRDLVLKPRDGSPFDPKTWPKWTI